GGSGLFHRIVWIRLRALRTVPPGSPGWRRWPRHRSFRGAADDRQRRIHRADRDAAVEAFQRRWLLSQGPRREFLRMGFGGPDLHERGAVVPSHGADTQFDQLFLATGESPYGPLARERRPDHRGKDRVSTLAAA